MGIVLKDFQCKETKKVYRAGETYEGNRLEELQELGYVSAEEGADKFPKHTGGGFYQLSNGDKVKGKDAALAAQAELDKQ